MGINPHWMPARPSSRGERVLFFFKRGCAPLKLPDNKGEVSSFDKLGMSGGNNFSPFGKGGLRGI
jgi:hypothetical protein